MATTVAANLGQKNVIVDSLQQTQMRVCVFVLLRGVAKVADFRLEVFPLVSSFVSQLGNIGVAEIMMIFPFCNPVSSSCIPHWELFIKIITNYKLQITNYPLPITHYPLPIQQRRNIIYT